MGWFWNRIRELYSQPLRWFYVASAWSGFVLLAGTLFAFRCVKTSTAAKNLIHIENIPVLDLVDKHYMHLYVAMAVLGHVFLAATLLFWNKLKLTRSGIAMFGFSLAAVTLSLITDRYSFPQGSTSPALESLAWMDWTMLFCISASAVLFLPSLAHLTDALEPPTGPCPEDGDRLPVRIALVYLVSTASVFLYGFMEHIKFWDPAKNGGYDYKPFFQAGEIVQANLVLYSTSVLFASVVGVAAAAAYFVFRWISRRGLSAGAELAPADCRRQALAAGAFWSLALIAPWQIKLMPDIRAEGYWAWIMPVGLLTLTAAALTPLLYVSVVLIKHDFDAQRRELAGAPGFLTGSLRVRRAEYAFLALFLCPFYPLLRLLRPQFPRVHYIGLMLFAALAVAALWCGLLKAEAGYDFDDWRGMMKSGVFPCGRVVLSLAVAYFIYLTAQRLLLGWNLDRPASAVRTWAGRGARGLAAACLLLALWPLWGWSGVHRNVLARTFEYSDRHRFEIGFLNWVLDYDGSGYASMLVDSRVRPYLSPPTSPDAREVKLGTDAKEPDLFKEMPEDRYEIRDAAKAKAFPNVVLLFLEGVTPRSISAFGERDLKALGRPATPHIDALAAEGTLFTHARCCYPSTWDGWFATLSGRFLRVQEMRESTIKDTDRYARHNGIHKILALAGVNRWCYPNTHPFERLFCPAADHDKDWENDFDGIPNKDEEDLEITRGDKCNERLLRFIDSIQPGEHFFFSEHLTDTHFPWKRTSDKRAAELGFPDGLKWCEKDAQIKDETMDRLARYFQTITRMDGQVGALVERLKQKGLYENTLIVIVGDHGCQWYEHEHLYYVSHLYEQSLHIPLIIKMPGLPKGIVSKEEVLQMDVVPTVAELAGVERLPPADPNWAPVGRSLAPLLRGESSPELTKQYKSRDVVLTTHFNMVGVIEEFRYKLTVDRLSGTYTLYNLETDPMEMNNLVDTEPEKVQALLEKMRVYANRNRAFFYGFNAVRP
ncbi:MAG: sulfatase-like hydrolase/transferase [Planctomycetes bacterium]|nr:sulfatase-like hydrolase/transferase [Planctomycetota bacterium]